MNERNTGQWSFAVTLGGLILLIVFCVMRLTHHDNALFLVVLGLLCGLDVCLGALIGWKERKLKSTKK